MDVDKTDPADGEPAEGADEKGLSRRKLVVVGGAAAGAAIGLGGTARPWALAKPPATTVGAREAGRGPCAPLRQRADPHDGRSDRVVQAVRIRNGKFVEIGPGVVKRGKNIIDLKGRTVGTGDDRAARAHRQPGEPARLPHADRGHPVDPEVQELLAGVGAACPEGQFITAMGGWHPNQWTERRLPTLAELDAAVSDRPVFLFQNFTGPSVSNTLGKQFFDTVTVAARTGPVDRSAPTASSPAGRRRRPRRALPPAPGADLRGQEAQHLDAMDSRPSSGITAHLDHVLFPTPGPLHPTQACRTSTTTACTTRGSRCIGRARRTSGCRSNFLHNQIADSAAEHCRS